MARRALPPRMLLIALSAPGAMLNLGDREFRPRAARPGAADVSLSIPGVPDTSPGRYAWWILALGLILAVGALVSWRRGLRGNDFGA